MDSDDEMETASTKEIQSAVRASRFVSRSPRLRDGPRRTVKRRDFNSIQISLLR